MRVWAAFIALLLTSSLVWAEAVDNVYARVNGKALTSAELETALYMAVRQRFFHGRMDDERLQRLRLDVLGDMIDRQLLLEEAKARGIKPDQAVSDEFYLQLQRRYGVKAMPEDHRQQIDAQLRQQAGEQALLQAFAGSVKAVAAPSEAQLQQFYQDNIDKFTTPPRLRLSVILLKVAPSAPVQAWRAAEEEANQLRRKIESGADFAQLAKLHSGDNSADNGGDLGFIHQGMLSQEAQQAVDGLQEGLVSAPVALLQGVALFRVEERQAAVVNPLSRVRERAQGLWVRQQSEQAWQSMLDALRAKARIEVLDGEVDASMIWVQGADEAHQ